jgi:hypothetical protein
MSGDKLSIYNKVLGHLGERKLASLAEDREPRRALDDYYPDVVAHCLEQGLWKFAKRKAQIEASSSVEPEFGFTYSFTKPDDWKRTIRISESSNLDVPLLRYREEYGYWEADCSTLYVEYISDHVTFGGGDLSRWTQLFEDYVCLKLAVQICPRISGSEAKEDKLEAKLKRALSAARGKDATAEPPQFPSSGKWVTSRLGGASRYPSDRTS